MGWPNQVGLYVLSFSAIILFSRYAWAAPFSKKLLGLKKIPRAWKRISSAGAPLLVTSLLLYVPYWTPRKAEYEYLLALNFRALDDASHRLAAIHSFDEAAKSSANFHWLMIEQVPAAIRAWTKSPTSQGDFAPEAKAESVSEVSSSPAFPISDAERPELLRRLFQAPAHAEEVKAAMWALSNRKREYETPSSMPPDIAREDHACNIWESLPLEQRGLGKFRLELEKGCQNAFGHGPEAIDDLPKPVGTDFPELRSRYWINLGYIDLSFAEAPRINFSGFDMTGCILNHAELAHSIFNKTNLANVRLNDANFWDADLREADMTDVQASHTDFGQADMRGVCLIKAKLQRSNFYETRLDNALLMGADLTNFDTFIGTKAVHANFWRAILYNANRSISLHKAEFDAAMVNSTRHPDDQAARARWDELRNITAKDLTDFSGAFLREADLRNAVFWNVKLDNADMTHAKLEGADFTDVDLRKVVGLTREQIAGAKVTESLLPKYLEAALGR